MTAIMIKNTALTNELNNSEPGGGYKPTSETDADAADQTARY